MSNFLKQLAASIGGLFLASCAAPSKNPPATARVDLQRYLGRWHEVARLPMPFQKANESAIAEYGLNPDGTIAVHNVAIRPDGSQHDIRGYATVLNPPQNSKLAVRFNTWFGPFIPMPKEGNYWVLYLDETYQKAIVGTPDRRYLWILARTQKLPEPQLQDLVSKAKEQGFDVTRLIIAR